jgi:tetratricopeptide (TPR) repeat protein
MRFTSPASGPSNWIAWKEKGRQSYDRGEYEDALHAYKAALSTEYECPASDRQILLSNMVACRLKIGGPAQARAALENAKQCVDINPSWAKGRVRLASAYVALGGHSNDACNELQSALRLDPGNSLARQMLIRELRRDHGSAAAASNADFDVEPPENPEYIPFPHRSTRNRTTNSPIDESPSWADRLRFHRDRLVTYYASQSEDTKAVVKIAAFLLFLYVAFGGRFGMELLFGQRKRGNYEYGNAYDRYYQNQRHGPHSGYDPSDSAYKRSRSGSEWNYSLQLFDGSLSSMAILLGVAYVCHRNGVNPLQALMVLNMIGGGRRRAHFGGGMGGFRMGRPRRRGGW